MSIIRRLTILKVLTVILFGMWILPSSNTTALALETECFSEIEIVKSFAVVYPNFELNILDGDMAKYYTEAYNGYGDQTEYKADKLLIYTDKNGIAMILFIEQGKSCHRAVAGSKLHDAIMEQIDSITKVSGKSA